MKTCEACGLNAPESAKLCKHCFHDFDDQAPKGASSGSTLILGALAAMSVVAAVTITVIVSNRSCFSNIYGRICCYGKVYRI